MNYGVEPDQAGLRGRSTLRSGGAHEERAREIAAAGVALWNRGDAGLGEARGPDPGAAGRREAEFFERARTRETPDVDGGAARGLHAIETDGSGYIETCEIEALMEQPTRASFNGKPSAGEAQKFIKFFDANDDGVVSFQEFRTRSSSRGRLRGSAS